MIAHLFEELAAKGTVRFAVRVRPNAPQTRLVSVLDDGSLKMDIAAPPEGGKANMELLRGVAQIFGVPRASVELLAGAADRHKIVKVTR